jgi:DNA-binding response OmpR family regulator
MRHLHHSTFSDTARRRTLIVRGSGRLAAQVFDLLKRTEGLHVVCDSDRDPASVDLMVLVIASVHQGLTTLQATNLSHPYPIVVVCPDPSPVAAADCLQAGADDYVFAPFDPRELVARVNRSLRERRGPLATAPPSRRAVRSPDGSPIELRDHDWTIAFSGSVMKFTEAQYRIAAYLIGRTGEWVRTTTLQTEVLMAHAALGASNVRFHVLKMRAALGEHAVHLHSWQRRGYMWSTSSCDAPHCLGDVAADN